MGKEGESKRCPHLRSIHAGTAAVRTGACFSGCAECMGTRGVDGSVADNETDELQDALEPHMSKSTLEFHWGKHHQTYVNNLNGQVEGKPEEQLTLEEVMKAAWNDGKPTPMFNNAGQVWNHDFFWQSMSPNGGGKPTGKLLEKIEESFGSYDDFLAKFKAAGAPGAVFGSGWVWLVETADGKLAIRQTPNAVNPLVQGEKCLLTYDCWEHAYYLDFQNRRPDYIGTFVDKLVNWDKVAERLG